MEDDLVRRFTQMSDDELQQYAASVKLDGPARGMLTAELSRRDLLPVGATGTFRGGNETDGISPAYRQLVRGLSPLNAQILLGRLHAEGVDAHLSGANVVHVDPLWFYALGGVRIFVRREHLAVAFEVLNATWKGDYEVAEQEDVVTPDSDSLSRKRLLGRRIVFGVALSIGGLSLAALWWPSCRQFFHPTVPVPRISVLGRGLASLLLLAYVAFWLLFVEGVIRRQKGA